MNNFSFKRLPLEKEFHLPEHEDYLIPGVEVGKSLIKSFIVAFDEETFKN